MTVEKPIKGWLSIKSIFSAALVSTADHTINDILELGSIPSRWSSFAVRESIVQSIGAHIK